MKSSLIHQLTYIVLCAGYDMSPFIRRYAKYLNEKSLSYRTVAFDFCKVKRGWVTGLFYIYFFGISYTRGFGGHSGFLKRFVSLTKPLHKSSLKLHISISKSSFLNQTSVSNVWRGYVATGQPKRTALHHWHFLTTNLLIYLPIYMINLIPIKDDHIIFFYLKMKSLW